MKLLTLRLKNFKGVRDFTLDANGENINVFADNGVGKTTLADAFMWLLFDKDSSNRKDFGIKTLDADGNVLHGLDHEVEGVLRLTDGNTVTLRKVYAEKWTKRRGSATAEFTGHTTDYYIDGVPVKKNEYTARIAEIADEGTFRLLTDPTYFNAQLHWQDRRKTLLAICGDISDEEVIASDKALADLPAILGKHTLDDHRKVIDSRRREINKELDRIPVRIDEATQALPDVPDGVTRELIEADIADMRAKRAAKEQERIRIESGGEIAEKQARLREIEIKLAEFEHNAQAERDNKVRQKQATLTELRDKVATHMREIRGIEGDIEQASRQAVRIEARMAELRQEWHRVNDEQLEHTHDETCPACGQDIPADQIEKAHTKALSEFNARKAKRLEEIDREGKDLKERLNTIHQDSAKQQDRLEQERAALATLERESEQLLAVIESIETTDIPETQDADYQKLKTEQSLISDDITQLRSGNSEALERVTAEIAELDHRISVAESALTRVDLREQGLQRIEQLKAEERKLAAEFEKLEHELHLCESFVRAKVSLLEDRINRRFEVARFKLFDVQVNGGIAETCETTFNGVPYSDLNHGAKLNVGLDIINTLADHHGFAPPVWIDNAESVTSILPTKGQQIRLVVSAGDKELRVETDANITKEVVSVG